MSKEQVKFTWVNTHKQLVDIIKQKRNQQSELIEALRKVGISGLHDENDAGERFELKEIDPFSFFCYIYKYGSSRRLKFLQAVAAEFNLPKPSDDSGIPSVMAQKVCLFPFESSRKNDEINRLWNIFESALHDNITDEQFQDVLTIIGTGKTKLTEGLFNILPDKFLPINGPTKPYLKEVLGIDPKFNTYSEYVNILEQVKAKVNIPFYELSYEAWKWNEQRDKVNYWIFQGNPNVYNVVAALSDYALGVWSVKAHKDLIKKGDKVILWVTGEEPGCYALCEVTSNVFEGMDDAKEMKYYTGQRENKKSTRVRIKITHNLADNPISQDQISKSEELADLKVGNQGTNFSATEEEYLKLVEMAGPTTSKKYWLFSPGEDAKKWDEFYSEGIMGLGWKNLGDLNQYKNKKEIFKKLQEIEGTKVLKRNDAAANYEFKEVVSIGDVIIVKKGRKELLGFGIVSSDYYFEPERESYQKCRKVDWKKKGNWKLGFNLVPKTLTDVTDYESDHPDYNYYYERLLGAMDDIYEPTMVHPLNVILYGPPGTGKTYKTVLRAAQIIENRPIDDYTEAQSIFNKHLGDRIEFITFHQNYSYEDFIQGLRPDAENEKELIFEKKDGVFKRLADRALKNLKESEQPQLSKKPFEDVFFKFIAPLTDGEVEEIEVPMKKVSFFITNITNRSIEFRKASGGSSHTLSISTLKKMYEAESSFDIQGLASYYKPLLSKLLELGKIGTEKIKTNRQNYVIIIDEINRANISRVFGELITLIELDKRSHGAIPLKCILPSGDEFIVPSNLHIIGTMNTADKSIALLDIALRRRFEFEAMYPKYEIDDHEIYDVDVLEIINEKIVDLKGHDFQIGHAFFMNENNDLVERINKKVIPLLLEYFMNDETEVKKILTSANLKIEEKTWPLRITGKA